MAVSMAAGEAWCLVRLQGQSPVASRWQASIVGVVFSWRCFHGSGVSMAVSMAAAEVWHLMRRQGQSPVLAGSAGCFGIEGMGSVRGLAEEQ